WTSARRRWLNSASLRPTISSAVDPSSVVPPFLLLTVPAAGEEARLAEGEPVFAIEEMAEGFGGEREPGRRARSTTRRARTVPANTTQIQGEPEVLSVSGRFWLMQILSHV